MKKLIKIESLSFHDNYSNRIIKVEPDLYINQYSHTRFFLRDDYFRNTINTLNAVTISSLISPSIFSSKDTLGEYTEILVEPIQKITDHIKYDFIFIMKEKKYYLSSELFDCFFKSKGTDILVD